MTAYRLDTVKLATKIDQVRRAGRRDEISFREIARNCGVNPDLFTRLNDGLPMRVDSWISVIMWADPEAKVKDYALPGDRRSSPPPPPRRRDYERLPAA